VRPRALLEPALAGGRGGKSFNGSTRGRETEEKYSDPPGSAHIFGEVANDGGTHQMAARDLRRGSAAADQIPESDFGLERWRLQHTANVKEVAEHWHSRLDAIWVHRDHEEVSGSLSPSHLSAKIATTLLVRSFTLIPLGHVRSADPSPSTPLPLLAGALEPTPREAHRLTLAIPSNGEQNV
jgi:hypothetical protein